MHDNPLELLDFPAEVKPTENSIYTASCNGKVWQLPRTHTIEAIARELMRDLTAIHCQGERLHGVLLGQTEHGENRVLKSFSGLWDGHLPGWVPPISNRARILLIENHVLATLSQLKAQLIKLNQLPVRSTHQSLLQFYQQRLEHLKINHRARKEERDRNRHHYHNTLQGNVLTNALDKVNRESQQDKLQLRQLKQERDQALAPLIADIAQAEQLIKELKQRYTSLSQHWQTQLQVAYAAEFFGKEQVTELGNVTPYLSDSLPVRVCDRAAAKLLHYAANHHLTPIAMAEFWWGPPQGNYHPGQFYDASPEECKLLMQIATMPPQKASVAITPLPILYQDDSLIVVDKPAGLLSVPGRRYHQQDSVLNRLRCQLPDRDFLQVAHRLDQATSGILVLATSPTAHKALSQQFAQHQVNKTYEAILTRPIAKTTGIIDLPLWGDPAKRPRQSVNLENGKPSVTHFQILKTGPQPRISFFPQTGRTHQLRVHAAHQQGLNSPIKGDTLYGQHHGKTERLHLHATSLEVTHPITHKRLRFNSPAPF